MAKKTFEYVWRNKWLTADAKTIADMVEALRAAADELEEMSKDGFKLDSGGAEDDYASLITNDAKVAKKWKADAIRD